MFVSQSRSKHDVQHWAWGGEQVTTSPPATSKEFVDVKLNVYREGGGKTNNHQSITFTAKDGSHKFTIIAADFKNKTKTPITQKIKRNTVYTVQAARTEKPFNTVEQGLVGKLGRKPKEIRTKDRDEVATGNVIFSDSLKSGNDNDDLQIEAITIEESRSLQTIGS